MRELKAAIFIAAAPAVVFAAVSGGGIGSRASHAEATILALVIEPAAAPGLVPRLLRLVGKTTFQAARVPVFRAISFAMFIPCILPGLAMFHFPEIVGKHSICGVFPQSVTVFLFAIWESNYGNLLLHDRSGQKGCFG